MKFLLKTIGALSLALVAFVLVWIGFNWEPDRSVDELASRWAQPPSRFMSIAGMQVHFRDEGRRDDPMPLVLLHGTSDSLHTWEGWAQALKDRRRVVRFDLPGFGLTGPAPDGRYRIEDYSRTVVAVLDALGIEGCVLAGNSLGGHIAWNTAWLHPERVARLVLVDSAGYPYQGELPIAFRVARTPVVSDLVSNVLPRRMIESSLASVYGDPGKVTPELVDRYFELATREGNRAALVERFKQTQPDPKATERLAQLRQPTLILWGGRDRLIRPEFGDRFAQDIPGSRLVVFEYLGHVPQEEDPARTVAALEQFLDGTTENVDGATRPQ